MLPVVLVTALDPAKERIKGLDAQPRPKELARLGEAWAPWRSTAAWYLWRAADEGKKVLP